jgi:hypothetical protein
MPDALGKIGGLFKTGAPAIAGGAGIAGLIGNLIASKTRGDEISKLQKSEKKFADLSPEALAGLVSRAEAPLGQDLLQSVGNTVQADMASRGLAESPGIFAATEAQALAPYKIQQQQLALQLVLKQMGLPIEYAQAIIQATGGNADVSKLLALLMNKGGGDTTGGVPDTTGLDIGKLLTEIGAGGTPPTVPSPDPGGPAL